MLKKQALIGGFASIGLIVAGASAFYYGNPIGAEPTETAPDASQGPPPAVVSVASTQSREIAPQADTPGSVVSTRDSLVASATSGKIEWVAEIGDEVEKDDVIARIDQSDAQLARDDSAAEVRRLQARALYLDRLYERFVGLGEDAGESEASMDEMRANRDEARQSLKQAEVAFERAKVNLQRTSVRAPFAGRVVNRQSQVGEYATPGTGLIRLVDTRKLEVTVRAPASLARNVGPGQTIAVSNGLTQSEATVRAIVPVGDALSRMLEMRLELPHTDWYIGSAVRVSLPSAQARKVVAVPRDALVLRSERVSVFVVAEDKTATRIDVELGAAEGDHIEVIGDIRAGDNVVVRGGERLRDGQKVTISTLLKSPTS